MVHPNNRTNHFWIRQNLKTSRTQHFAKQSGRFLLNFLVNSRLFHKEVHRVGMAGDDLAEQVYVLYPSRYSRAPTLSFLLDQLVLRRFGRCVPRGVLPEIRQRAFSGAEMTRTRTLLQIARRVFLPQMASAQSSSAEKLPGGRCEGRRLLRGRRESRSGGALKESRAVSTALR